MLYVQYIHEDLNDSEVSSNMNDKIYEKYLFKVK